MELEQTGAGFVAALRAKSNKITTNKEQTINLLHKHNYGEQQNHFHQQRIQLGGTTIAEKYARFSLNLSVRRFHFRFRNSKIESSFSPELFVPPNKNILKPILKVLVGLFVPFLYPAGDEMVTP